MAITKFPKNDDDRSIPHDEVLAMTLVGAASSAIRIAATGAAVCGRLSPAACRREARLAGSEAAVDVPKGGAGTVPHLSKYGRSTGHSDT